MERAPVEGVRVLRGPHWDAGDEDGGEGHLGTVLSSPSNGVVHVVWDTGQESTCRAGADGKFDLRVFDTATVGVFHPGTKCSACDVDDIHGTLWRCVECQGCDLCPVCYADDKHNKRKISVRIRAMGMFPGAKVTRGKDWSWRDQDGGEGSEGEMLEFFQLKDPQKGKRNLVRVAWPHGKKNVYRLGYEGHVDVMCSEEEAGGFYYRDHLPCLDTSNFTTQQERDASAAVYDREESASTTAEDKTRTTENSDSPQQNDSGIASPVDDSCAGLSTQSEAVVQDSSQADGSIADTSSTHQFAEASGNLPTTNGQRDSCTTAAGCLVPQQENAGTDASHDEETLGSGQDAEAIGDGDESEGRERTVPDVNSVSAPEAKAGATSDADTSEAGGGGSFREQSPSQEDTCLTGDSDNTEACEDESTVQEPATDAVDEDTKEEPPNAEGVQDETSGTEEQDLSAAKEGDGAAGGFDTEDTLRDVHENEPAAEEAVELQGEKCGELVLQGDTASGQFTETQDVASAASSTETQDASARERHTEAKAEAGSDGKVPCQTASDHRAGSQDVDSSASPTETLDTPTQNGGTEGETEDSTDVNEQCEPASDQLVETQDVASPVLSTESQEPSVQKDSTGDLADSGTGEKEPCEPEVAAQEGGDDEGEEAKYVTAAEARVGAEGKDFDGQEARAEAAGTETHPPEEAAESGSGEPQSGSKIDSASHDTEAAEEREAGSRPGDANTSEEAPSATRMETGTAAAACSETPAHGEAEDACMSEEKEDADVLPSEEKQGVCEVETAVPSTKTETEADASSPENAQPSPEETEGATCSDKSTHDQTLTGDFPDLSMQQEASSEAKPRPDEAGADSRPDSQREGSGAAAVDASRLDQTLTGDSSDALQGASRDAQPRADGHEADSSPDPQLEGACAAAADDADAGGEIRNMADAVESKTEIEDDPDVFKVGDRVAIKVSEERLQEFQIDFGGTTSTMLRCLGKTGVVTGMTSQGALNVKFKSLVYRFNPAVFIKVHELHVGDTVRIVDDLELLRVLSRRLPWRSRYPQSRGKVGTITEIDSDGDVTVSFGHRSMMYAPAACRPAPGAKPDTLGDSDSRDYSNTDDNSVVGEGSGRRGGLMERFSQFLKDSGLGGLGGLGGLTSISDLMSGSGGTDMDKVHRAIMIGDVDKVTELCTNDRTLLNKEHHGLTPLMLASHQGKLKVVRALLDIGADVNAEGLKEQAPLGVALEEREEEVAMLLLERGADPRHKNGKQRTPLHMAVFNRMNEVAQILIHMGADVNVQILIYMGGEVNVQDKYGDTPLHDAIARGNTMMLDLLLQLDNVQVNLVNRKGYTPLQLACRVSNAHATGLLLARDCSNVDALQNGDLSALHRAVINNFLDGIRLLVINGGANINIQSGNKGLTALHMACLHAQEPLVEALVELGADVNVQEYDGETALHLAMGGTDGKDKSFEEREKDVQTRIRISTLLITNGAFVDAENRKGKPPTIYGHAEIQLAVQQFIQKNPHLVKLKASSDNDPRGPTRSYATTSVLKDVSLPCTQCGGPSDVTLVPCGHQTVCNKCSASVKFCPLCGCNVDKKATKTDKSDITSGDASSIVDTRQSIASSADVTSATAASVVTEVVPCVKPSAESAKADAATAAPEASMTPVTHSNADVILGLVRPRGGNKSDAVLAQNSTATPSERLAPDAKEPEKCDQTSSDATTDASTGEYVSEEHDQTSSDAAADASTGEAVSAPSDDGEDAPAVSQTTTEDRPVSDAVPGGESGDSSAQTPVGVPADASAGQEACKDISAPSEDGGGAPAVPQGTTEDDSVSDTAASLEPGNGRFEEVTGKAQTAEDDSASDVVGRGDGPGGDRLEEEAQGNDPTVENDTGDSSLSRQKVSCDSGEVPTAAQGNDASLSASDKSDAGAKDFASKAETTPSEVGESDSVPPKDSSAEGAIPSFDQTPSKDMAQTAAAETGTGAEKDEAISEAGKALDTDVKQELSTADNVVRGEKEAEVSSPAKSDIVTEGFARAPTEAANAEEFKVNTAPVSNGDASPATNQAASRTDTNASADSPATEMDEAARIEKLKQDFLNGDLDLDLLLPDLPSMPASGGGGMDAGWVVMGPGGPVSLSSAGPSHNRTPASRESGQSDVWDPRTAGKARGDRERAEEDRKTAADVWRTGGKAAADVWATGASGEHRGAKPRSPTAVKVMHGGQTDAEARKTAEDLWGSGTSGGDLTARPVKSSDGQTRKGGQPDVGEGTKGADIWKAFDSRKPLSPTALGARDMQADGGNKGADIWKAVDARKESMRREPVTSHTNLDRRDNKTESDTSAKRRSDPVKIEEVHKEQKIEDFQTGSKIPEPTVGNTAGSGVSSASRPSVTDKAGESETESSKPNSDKETRISFTTTRASAAQSSERSHASAPEIPTADETKEREKQGPMEQSASAEPKSLRPNVPIISSEQSNKPDKKESTGKTDAAHINTHLLNLKANTFAANRTSAKGAQVPMGVTNNLAAILGSIVRPETSKPRRDATKEKLTMSKSPKDSMTKGAETTSTAKPGQGETKQNGEPTSREGRPEAGVTGSECQKEAAPEVFAVGDLAALKVTEQQLGELQKDFGGMTKGMVQCMGRTGTVVEVAPRGTVRVKFSSLAYKFNPAALIKVPHLSTGDTVRIVSDLDLYRLLNKRVGWCSDVHQVLGKVGKITQVDKDGDVTVSFGPRSILFAPATCCPAPGATPDALAEGDVGKDSPESRATGESADGGSSERQALMKRLAEMVKQGATVSQAMSSSGDSDSAMSRLFHAIKEGNSQAVKAVCQSNPSLISAPNPNRQLTPLMYACHKGEVEIARMLLDMGADVNGTGGFTDRFPLSVALESEQEQAAILLIDHGANIHYRSGRQRTPLHMAAFNNLSQALQILILKGADVNATDRYGDTALIDALQKNRREAADILLKVPNVNVLTTNHKGVSALHVAAIHGNVSAIEQILELDRSEVNSLMGGEFSALHIAANDDFEDVVRLIVINGGADVNVEAGGSRKGLRPLHMPCLRGYMPVVEALLDLGAMVNVADKDGETPLHFAMGGRTPTDMSNEMNAIMMQERVRIACTLISNGAFVDAENSKGRTPMRYGPPEVQAQKKGRTSADASRPTQVLKGVPLPCAVCSTAMSDVTLLPCGHKTACSKCSVTLTVCPLCQSRVDGTTRD
ncbi:hypothetical protein BaRGS_00012008, partial [Batillaria attramentaria]